MITDVFSLDNYRAVIFDFDGVLANTMKDNFAAWEKTFAEINIKFDAEEYYLLEGLKASGVARHFMEKFKVEHLYNQEELVAKKEAHYLALNKFSFYPNTLNLIRFLKKNKKLALVTGAGSERVKFSRNSSEEAKELFDAFTIIVTSNDVVHGKPSPEPYLKALSGIGIDAKKVLVVENAPLGIRSAKDAGIDCVALASTLDASKLSDADWCFASLDEFYFKVINGDECGK